MNIKSFDDCEQIMDLDINTLEDGKEYDKICYLLNYKAGLTKQDKGFYTFYVKDKNANVVAARMFDIKDYVDEGFTAMLMKSKAVKISFVAQIWNGSWSLVVKNIEIWNGNFSYENYIGKAEYSVDALEAVYESLCIGEILHTALFLSITEPQCTRPTSLFLYLYGCVLYLP